MRVKRDGDVRIQALYDKLARKATTLISVSVFCAYVSGRLNTHGYPEFLSVAKNTINALLGLISVVSFFLGFSIYFYLLTKAAGSLWWIFGYRPSLDKFYAAQQYWKGSYAIPYLYLIPAILIFEIFMMLAP